MTSPTTDRRFGVNGSLAFKAPVRAATTANITLSGLQTIDGVALAADDRVLVKDQTTTTENGIYVASSSAWTRDVDANGNRDLVRGTSVYITDGTTLGGSYWQASVTNPVTFGSSVIAWARALVSSISTLSFIQSGVGAVIRAAQDKMRDQIADLDFMTAAQIADVQARTALLDVTADVQEALDKQSTSVVGSFQLQIPDGTRSVTKAGARILQVQAGGKVIGETLEASRFKVAGGSTATAMLEDDGSAAKVELNNLTLDGNSNGSLTSGLRLGRRSTQFGTYGTLDNIMVRDMPNATAFDLNTNVAAVGKLYSINTKDGLVSNAAGSGLHIESLTPYGFSGIGYQMASGDSCNFVEAEAPSANAAIPLVFERGGSLSNFILSIQAGRTVLTPVQINTTFFEQFYLGQTTVFRGSSGATGTSRYGNSASPADSGTASAGGVSTLTDSTKTWGLDQWKGGAIFITGGTGVGQWQRILSNTARVITCFGSWDTAPDNTSTYALDYFIKKTAGGGFAHSDSMSAYWPAFYNATVSNQLRANTAVQGLLATPDAATTLSSTAATIAPTKPIHFVSGTGTITTITPPSPISLGGGQITLIPTSTWQTTTSGNIARASDAVVSRAITFTYDATTTKWYPSST